MTRSTALLLARVLARRFAQRLAGTQLGELPAPRHGVGVAWVVPGTASEAAHRCAELVGRVSHAVTVRQTRRAGQ